eukprot:12626157-Ditylum_brightwellii.AAC.1
MLCRSKYGLYGHYDHRDIDCPLNDINICNKNVVKGKIMPVMEQMVYRGPKAKMIEEREKKIEEIMKKTAQKDMLECSSRVSNDIDGTTPTMIVSAGGV